MRIDRRFATPVLLTALLAAGGCATVRVTAPADAPAPAATDAPQRNAHWTFDAARRGEAQRDGYQPPAKLAVLLPLSGPLEQAAAPVRDGLLAAYHGERRAKPELAFYDTAGTAAGATAALARAVAEGADQVVGPLGRDEVEAVYRGAQPAVPVLALNRVDLAPPANHGGYSLAPEDDGTGAARYLLSRSARRVLVLSAGDDNARRSVAAFDEALRAEGGTVVQVVAVTGEKPADMTALLREASMREGGIDAVFFALRAPQARALAGQLSMAGLAGKPRVATTQLLSGTGKPEEDRALDGIAFPTESWAFGNVPGLPNAAITAKTLPTARGAAQRLFAFGHDAWLLSAYLPRLALDAQATVPGAGGVLRIDATGVVRRTPAWATFSGGQVVPLAGAAGG